MEFTYTYGGISHATTMVFRYIHIDIYMNPVVFNYLCSMDLSVFTMVATVVFTYILIIYGCICLCI